LEDILETGENYTLNFRFNGSLKNRIVGFYSSVYQDEKGADR
jgi:hypothetical protein